MVQVMPAGHAMPAMPGGFNRSLRLERLDIEKKYWKGSLVAIVFRCEL
jgi:hypothetical protein